MPRIEKSVTTRGLTILTTDMFTVIWMDTGTDEPIVRIIETRIEGKSAESSEPLMDLDAGDRG